MQNSGFLYIPDISGFTKFVTQTEIEHSNEIISDLIEVIIKSNNLGLNISEIEGDSVLFYLLGEPPVLEAIVDQSKRTFLDFHAAIQAMTQEFDCNCKACTTISNLTLEDFGQINTKYIPLSPLKNLVS
jgi:hypothetical protein